MAVSSTVIVNNPNPAPEAQAIVVGTAFPKATRAIYIGTSGNITVTMENGDSVTFANVVSGTVLPIRCTVVSAATASNLVAMF